MRRATGPACRAALIAPMPCADQAELLRAFDLPIALMQDAEALERIAAELVETKAADGVRYLEIRWGPLLHVAGGLALADGIAAVCRGAQDAAHRNGTVVRLIATALRSHDPEANVDAGRDRGALPRPGPDRLGPRRPRGGVPGSDGPRRRVRGRHGRAACGSPSMPASGAARPRSGGRWTLEPERIAHGPSAVDDPELCAELIERRVTLDLCPTSNWQAGIVPSLAEHPLARLDRVGVSVTLSTDDTTVSDITLSEEYLNAVETIGLTVPELWEIDLHALDVAFADEEDLAPLRAAFAAWGEGVPELADI